MVRCYLIQWAFRQMSQNLLGNIQNSAILLHPMPVNLIRPSLLRRSLHCVVDNWQLDTYMHMWKHGHVALLPQGSSCLPSVSQVGIAPISKTSNHFLTFMGFPGDSDGKRSFCKPGDPGLIIGSGRSPGEGNGYPLKYSSLENPMDRGACWAIVLGVAELDMTEELTFSLHFSGLWHLSINRSHQCMEQLLVHYLGNLLGSRYCTVFLSSHRPGNFTIMRQVLIVNTGIL